MWSGVGECGPKPHLKVIPGIILSKGINTHKQRQQGEQQQQQQLRQVRLWFAFVLSFVAAVKRTHAPALRVLYATAATAAAAARIRHVSWPSTSCNKSANKYLCCCQTNNTLLSLSLPTSLSLLGVVCPQFNPFIESMCCASRLQNPS